MNCKNCRGENVSCCLYGNLLALEKMRWNPINTAAGKSRKTPQDPQWTKQPRTHILTGFETPTIYCTTYKSSKIPEICKSNWTFFKRCCQENELHDPTVCNSEPSALSLNCTAASLLSYQGPSCWPRLYLTHSGTQQTYTASGLP